MDANGRECTQSGVPDCTRGRNHEHVLERLPGGEGSGGLVGDGDGGDDAGSDGGDDGDDEWGTA